MTPALRCLPDSGADQLHVFFKELIKKLVERDTLLSAGSQEIQHLRLQAQRRDQAQVGYNLRFPGQVFDGQVGLHSNYYRDFDPAIGRYSESDPIGLAGGTNTYFYAKGNPVSKKDRFGLQVEGEEEDDKIEEPPIVETITRVQVDNIVDQIRQYDPNFKYATAAPRGFRYGRQDIEHLQDILRQYQSDTACRINYGSTPEGTPFSRHYGVETGPVRGIPGSLIDQILKSSPGSPGRNNTTVYYDPVNDVTVVTGISGIVSVHRGKE